MNTMIYTVRVLRSSCLGICLFCLLVLNTIATEYKGPLPAKMQTQFYKMEGGGCAPSTSQADLDVNNVRAKILGGGDMWWDPGATTAKYEVPKGSGKHALFAGAIWVGGVDAGGTLKVAAMTYRQSGNDFFPGPLSSNSVSISATECEVYNKHWKVTRKEVEAFAKSDFQNPSPSIASWPGTSATGEFMAPFYDHDGNGLYEPKKGDYPYYKISGQAAAPIGREHCSTCTGSLYGDQSVWWVFNDVGNIHTQTGAQPIGLEVQAQGFAFATNDEVNNMTFYQYKIINRSSFQLNNTYIGQWTDPDLGNANDDFVGCDVSRGLGYCYNGYADDSGPNGYGTNPPAIGIDFFQGPIADSNDGIDNNRNGIVDEPCEQIIMSNFVYYNNDLSVRGEPFTATDHYNYLKGIWKDGTSMTYGGSGYNTGAPCSFMFPDNTDVLHPVPWTEDNSNNTPGDRRFLQSAGKFSLAPGAVNFVTVGVVWARASQGGRLAAIPLLKAADDKAQSLFNNCFKVLDGPDAPDLSIRELDKELILSLSDLVSSNNYLESYSETDPAILGSDNNQYKFQGYQIFQLKDYTVTASDVHNPDKARLVAQCDIQDDVAQLVNFYYDPSLNASIPVEEVNGANKGIFHTFQIRQDLFASGNAALINHKPYYYTVLAYAYNRYAPYNPGNSDTLIYGQKRPYFPGRNNLKTYSAIPHNPMSDNNGQILLARFGNGPRLQRLEGSGNGGLVLDLTAETVQEIITGAAHQVLNPMYDYGRGPVNIQVYDPVKVPKANFKLILQGGDTALSSNSKWKLINLNTGEVVRSTQTIAVKRQQIIPQWGLAVDIGQSKNPGEDMLHGNGFLESSMTFSDSSHAWLTGLKDEEGVSPFNWIRSGKFTSIVKEGIYNDYDYTLDPVSGKLFGNGIDDNQNFENCVGGTWAPYRLCSKYENGPAKSNVTVTSDLSNLSSVDVVLTPDKSKWSRSPVLEMSEDPLLSEGGASKFTLRRHASVNKEGRPDGTGNGMSWFPGYAINVETGERLNIMFGEDSWLKSENGQDMMWNPTSNITSPFGTPLFGGKHFIYIMGNVNTSKYDSGKYIFKNLSNNTPSFVFRSAYWVSIPLLVKKENLLSNAVKIRLRVSKPYTQYATSFSPFNNSNPAYAFTTSDLMAVNNNVNAAKIALETINVVPNPYYAYAAYENNQLDHRIKITNLPPRCTIAIYTVNGTLVRKFNRDISKYPDTSSGGEVGTRHSENALEWDLKNTAGIPVASGLYIIHIDAGPLGEKILKWVGMMRPIDLDTF